jgi:TatA/E family protein of Tat protein translocase
MTPLPRSSIWGSVPMTLPPVLAFGWAPSGAELIVLLVLALLLFGKRLPEVARNLGKGVVEFKNGIRGIENDVKSSVYDELR